MSAISDTEIGCIYQNRVTPQRSFDTTIIFIYVYQFTKKSDNYNKGWLNPAEVIKIKPRQMQLEINRGPLQLMLSHARRSWLLVGSMWRCLESEAAPNLAGHQTGPCVVGQEMKLRPI